ncbi:MAG: CPBP family intramembrane metalloprotease [Myxococcota bacterium]|nr:CPBP family intramembrane metalloprotease [Myxococcota bacterium]
MDDGIEGKGHRIRWWHGLVFFVAVMAVHGVLLVVITLLGVYGLLGDNPTELLFSPLAVSAQVLFTCCVLTGFALGLPRAFRVAALPWLKLGQVNLKVVGVAVIGIVGVGLLIDEVIFLMHTVAPEVFNSRGLEVFNRIFTASPLPMFALLTVIISIGPGIGEELFFRGFVFRAFHTSWSSPVAIFGSALLFGVMHMDLLQGFGAFLIGIYLGFVALRTGSIWPCMAAHAANNFLCALFARFDADAIGQIWRTGHSPLMIVIALALCVACVYGLVWLTKPAHKES